MARNHKPKQDNPEQSKRFIETAQALDAGDSAAAFERVAKVISAISRLAKTRTQHLPLCRVASHKLIA
jgi:hypothetical protein